MSDLSAFFAENVAPLEEVEIAVSERMLDKDGKPIKWKVKAITSAVNSSIEERAMRVVNVPGKRGQRTREIDYTRYSRLLVCDCVTYPNLNDAGLQDSYHAKSADELIAAMLTAGEFTELSAKCLEICGFDVPIDEEIEQAKN